MARAPLAHASTYLSKTGAARLRGAVQILFSCGKYRRIWPFFDPNHKKLYVSIGLLRPLAEEVCRLLVSEDYGQSWDQIADFHSFDKRNTTTGQPFVTKDGSIFIPVWNAGFYTHGETWLAIYKSEDCGFSWKKVYEDPRGTYGKHFFQSPFDDSLYLGVGVEGGGHRNRVSSTPRESYLLRSQNYGETWCKVLQINYPTAIYSGTTIDPKTVIVAAREKKSVFTSTDGCVSWTEIEIGNTARNISYFRELDTIVVSSNSSIFLSNDGFSWVRLCSPIKWLILRYPILSKGRIFLAGVGGRSIVLSTNLKEWYALFDVTEVAGSNLFSRMAVAGDYIFLGNELSGVLLRVRLPIGDGTPIDISQRLGTNLKSLVSISRHVIESLVTRGIL